MVREDERHVNITIEAFLRENVYSIDKATKVITYIQSEKGLYGPSNAMMMDGWMCLFTFFFSKKKFFLH